MEKLIKQKEKLIKQKKNRKERAIFLLKKGLILEVLGVLNLKKEILLGYMLFSFNQENKELYSSKGEKFFHLIKDLDEKENLKLNEKEIKERNHKLITKGALFEIASLENKTVAELLGFFLFFKDTSETEKEVFLKKGEIYFNQKN